MLYCPKCDSKYEDGSQRFCTNDGIRLLPGGLPNESVDQRSASQKAVFTNLINKEPKVSANDEQVSAKPRFRVPSEGVRPPQIPAGSRIFRENQPGAPAQAKGNPVVRLVKPAEIASGTAEIGDRQANPPGRKAITAAESDSLVGQTVKGRYSVQRKIFEDQYSVAYLAEDKILSNKQVLVRILLNESKDDFIGRILAEERVALSHVSHPNIASVIDSGQLPEGFPFLVTEFVDSFSLRDKLSKIDQFNSLRTARIIKQVANGLSEVHQNGILHRNLRPENVFLTISDAGVEQAVVTGFVVSDGKPAPDSPGIVYSSPEQLEGKAPSYASDLYSLGVVAYQMLTGRLPFNSSDARNLLKAQKGGLSLRPSNLRLDVSPEVDKVFDRALAFDPADRYPNVRDFGDALAGALEAKSGKATFIDFDDSAEPVGHTPDAKIANNRLTIAARKEQIVDDSKSIHISATPDAAVASVDAKPISLPKSDTFVRTSSASWEERSPDAVQVGGLTTYLMYGLIFIGLVGALLAGYYYLSSRPANQEYSAETAVPANVPGSDNSANTGNPANADEAPIPRKVAAPPNSNYFENSKEGRKGELLRDYRGFSFYYPNYWQKASTATAFVDVYKLSPNGTLLEKFVVNPYKSEGLYSLDLKQFPKLVESANKKFADKIKNYKLISQGETMINNSWRAYQMKFQGDVVGENGDSISLWGRTIFIPAANKNFKNGIAVTLLATSMSPDVKNVDDVGTKGELYMIMDTFEPSQSE